MSNGKFTRNHKIFKSKWFIPGLYVSGLAIVMIGAFALQNLSKGSDFKAFDGINISGISDEISKEVTKSFSSLSGGEDDVVKLQSESFAMPLKDSDNVVIKMQFYEQGSSTEAQEAALLKYGDTYQPSTGIDYALSDNANFGVIASMSGIVTKVQADPLLGNVIEVEHSDGIVSHYSSVSDVAVNVGDEVTQGQTLANASTSQINPDAGVHVHYELRKDGVAVNPTDYMQKPVSSLEDAVVVNGIDTIKSEAVSPASAQGDKVEE